MADRARDTGELRYARAVAAYEAAVMSGEQAARRAALVELDAAGEARAQLLRRLAAPDFLTLLSDSTIQPDREGRILASIEEYRKAQPASAGIPLERGRRG